MEPRRADQQRTGVAGHHGERAIEHLVLEVDLRDVMRAARAQLAARVLGLDAIDMRLTNGVFEVRYQLVGIAPPARLALRELADGRIGLVRRRHIVHLHAADLQPKWLSSVTPSVGVALFSCRTGHVAMHEAA
jgi:hypothetical protein